MSFAFENQGTNTYLVYEIGANDELDTMSLGMLTNNAIPGFAAASFTQMDSTRYIKYNVSAKVSVSQLFTGAVNKKRLIGVFSGIIDAMLSAEDYMLDSNSLVLDLDYIFADVSTCETIVVCLPVLNGERRNPELGMFFKNIIFNTQFDRTENCDHVALILNYLNSNPVLSLADFKDLLDGIGQANEPVKAAQPKVAAAEPVAAFTGARQPIAAPTAPPVSPTPPQAEVTTRPKRENVQSAPSYTAVSQPSVPVMPQERSVPQAPPQARQEKRMSMFYLLQHYNKENAAIYKAQQEAKKAKKGSAAAPVAQPVQPKAAPKQMNAGFAIPGKQETVSPSFAVPKQQAAVPVQKPVQPVVKAEAQPIAPKPTPAPVYEQPVQTSSPIQMSTPISFGETTVLSGGVGETTVLCASENPTKVSPYLIRMKNNEKIPLNKPVFRIGKERSYVDYFIGDNTAISRSHANIINRNGAFFIVDTNSTNHTYVNGGMINSNEEIKLAHGTKIRLANEDFEFRMY